MKAKREARGGLVAQHGKALVEIAGVSILGILATAGFQIITIRGLGPADFGLLASFLALINVASVGSSALRNSVAVSTAEALNSGGSFVGRGRIDSSLVEALVLGALGTTGVFIFGLTIAPSGAGGLAAVALTAAAIIPYFLFSRAQGRIQGTGDSRSVVWWSTGAQIAQAVLALVAVLLGAGAAGVLVVLVVTAVAGAFGASAQARRIGLYGAGRPFSMSATVVLLLTVGFAWLTNADVVYVRALVPEELAGAYAAAAVVIKTTLVIPTTLSLYLLPRFVRSRGDASMTNLGVNVILGVTLVSGIVMFVFVFFFGGVVVDILFGARYEDSVPILIGLALSWIPWALSQGILVRTTAAVSKAGVIVIAVAALAQWASARLFLPNITWWLVANGCVGLLVFVGLYISHHLSLRRSAPKATDRIERL